MKKIFFTIIIALVINNAFTQITISEARNMTLGSTVTVTGIVTNGSELGVIRYIQDETAGVALYPGTGSVDFSPNRGDSITITGTLKEYNQLIEIDPITAVTIHSTGNTLPEPLLLTPSQIGESYEGQLAKVENSTFADAGSTFSGSNNYNLTSNGETFVVRVNSNSDIAGQTIPSGLVDITSIVSQYSYSSPDEGYQLLLRDLNDIQLLSPLYFTNVPEESNLTTTGFTISWETNEASSTEIAYGLTQNLELGVFTGDANVTQHSYTITGFDAGTIYYLKAYSVSGVDTTPSVVKPYVTVSESSGLIKVYFNHAVDNSVSTGVDAVAIPGEFTDTIISYIDKAEKTLDICVYNNNMASIVSAINSAYNRGVIVRYITEDETANLAFSSLNANIPVLPGNTGGLMHNKILIIDADSTENAWVVTGSTNFTDNNLDDDYNNLICFQDQSLARAYRIEFEEMWGGSGNSYNVANSKFGSDKTDNTPHKFIINSIPVELYFSPSDNVTSEIQKTIETTDTDLEFALLTFTRNELGAAVVDVFNAGAEVKGIIENPNDSGSEYDYLIASGVDVLPHTNPHDIHHKYAIIDSKNPDSSPKVITGSHNWSSSAENNNDENTVIISDATIANLYYQEFYMRWQELTPTSAPTANSDEITVVKNISKTFDVTENDDYLSNLELIITTLTQPQNGTLVLNADNSYTYTPNDDFLGEDTFTYRICYSAYPGLCSETTSNLTIVEEEAPIAIDDTASIDMNSAITVNVIANDLNPNNVDLVKSIIKESTNGNEIMIDSNITYVPNHNFEGIDTVIYEICSANNDTLCSRGLFIIKVGNIISVRDFNKTDNKLKVFPNPNNGSFEINISATNNNNSELSIYNLLGKLVYYSTVNLTNGENKIPVSVQNLEKGIYYISIKSIEKIYTQKIIISNN